MSERLDENKRNELLTVWTTYSRYCEEVTNKRHIINAFFLGIISALVGFIIGMWGVIGLVLSVVGFLITIFWFLYIRSYKKLNSAKFEVLLGIEEQLGINIYSLEWQKVKEKKYIRLTTVEYSLVVVFILGFIALFVISILKIKGVML